MSRLRDRIAPVMAVGLVLAVAVSVLVLLQSASNRGTQALASAKVAQVQSLANSFNARMSSQIAAVAGFGTTRWDLKPGSKADVSRLQAFNVNPQARSGFFLIDGNDRVTGGVLLRSGAVGSRYEPPGWAEVKQKLTTAPAAVLPVTQNGLTTDLPSYAFAVAIRGDTPTSVRGALIAEAALVEDSSFQQEIAQLAEPSASTAAWYFVDTTGVVVAATDAAALGTAVEDPRYLSVPTGRSDVADLIVVAGDIPAIGWRVVFRQDRGEFEQPLSGPLEKAGLVLVALLFAVGITLVAVLVQRLRAAREEQRRLRDLTRSQAEFISVVSHELRTPVAGVLGFLQTTIDHWNDLSDDERIAAVSRAATNARRLQTMTRDVLDIDSIESGRFGYAMQRVELGPQLLAAVETAQAQDSAHRILLEPPPPVTVDVDPDRLQQVLSNLLENARKNAPASAPIEVHAAVSDEHVRIAVIDRGPGVDAALVDRIFEKFVRSNGNAVAGTGLGLYIARRIVEAHHGRIWCESTPGDRTAFVVELPVAVPGTPLAGVAGDRIPRARRGAVDPALVQANGDGRTTEKVPPAPTG
jgi:signal transduction histidine kinase